MDPINTTEPRRLTKYARLVSKDGPFEADIVLYGAVTPNTHKVAVLLEAIGVAYDIVPIDISKNEQKEPWFVRICPNGRTPAMIDRSTIENEFALFESGAMLLYLCDKYGSSLLPREPRARSEVEQWIMWQMSALGPMLGNCMYFKRIASPFEPDTSKLQFGIDRYHNESVRLLNVLDERLRTRDYLCGIGRGTFSAADIACHGYCNAHWWAGIDISQMLGLSAWLARVSAIPAVQAGMSVPAQAPYDAVEMRALVEQNAKNAGRPHFGWRDIAEVRNSGDPKGVFRVSGSESKM